MELFSVIDLDFSRRGWEAWAVPVIGVLTAGLTLLAGRAAIRRRRARGDGAASHDDHDPFEDGSASERRATVRRKGNHVEILVTDADSPDEPIRGWVVDRSLGGLALLLSQPRPEGTVLSIRPRQCPSVTPWVPVEVRTCKEDRGGYELGCQFQRTPPWNVILLFG